MIEKQNSTQADSIIGAKFYSQLATATVARLLLNTARRFVYPFAPALSRGLNVPLPAIISIIAVFQASALLGFFIGPVTDRWGYRRMMLAGMWMTAFGLSLGAIFPHYFWVMAGLFIAGLGKTLFDPAIQAYIGRAVPYSRRGQAVGVIEASWGGATLAGVPLIGLLMARFGWQSGFWGLAVAALLGGVAILCVFPPDRCEQENQHEQLPFWQTWRQLASHGPAQGMLLFTFFISISNDAFFVVYGVFLESRYGVSLGALGLTVVIIGIAEIIAEMLTALIGDRLGLHRAVVLGTLGTIGAYLLLPFSGEYPLAWALGNIFLVFLAFEFAMVTSISFCTEVMPAARATMMAGFYGIAAVGRVIGALSGGLIWTHFGWVPLCLFAAVAGGLALAGVLWSTTRMRKE